MLITIRQGIVRVPTSPLFLTFSSGAVNLNANVDPVIVAFADGTGDYLLTESQSIAAAWTGPFVGGTDYWLYWDIDKDTALRTFGSTTVAPTFGNTRPATPTLDQHFFDTSINKMVVWSGTRWVERLRVFAGRLDGGTMLVRESEGSQINLNQSRFAGHILFDDQNSPVKRANGQFLTSESPLSASFNQLNAYKLEARQTRARAVESIPKFHAVTWRGPNTIGLASSANPDKGEAVGIAVEDINRDEVKKFATDGFIINEAWNFSSPPGTLLFVGQNGEVTTTVPQRISLQRIGQVVDRNTAFIRIEELFKIDSIVPTLTPTPTPSVTPTIAPTTTPAVTPTITPSVTPTISPSAPTPTVTPTVTASVTPTTTPPVPTPSVTPSPSDPNLT